MGIISAAHYEMSITKLVKTLQKFRQHCTVKSKIFASISSSKLNVFLIPATNAGAMIR